ncbi:LamG-like jellyroll fold domain-containing protein [Parvicella tangerina]|uniref:DUF8202 domain-containing protein n=1 Tax=Parvicella tangerina TaxID=2829795 RepID=A0A916JHU8_9FLAO|nr:LamG-like jellyroll fold domain-containing protein [Parvicella tangerina]CAG5076305.1 hypothetical protein CRYO30217_00057 [Parvicella tangerina]
MRRYYFGTLHLTLFFFLLLGDTSLLAQTGPAGIRSSATNELWLVTEGNAYTDAGTSLGTDGNSIQQWNDISGNGNHATQTNASLQPTLSTNKANGFSSLVFEGSSSRILSSGLNSNGEVSIFVVVMLNGLTNNNDGIIQGSPAGNAFTTVTSNKNIGMWVNTGNGNLWGRGIQSNNTTRNIPQTTALSTGQFYVVEQHYDGTNITQYVNGTVAGSTSYDGTLKSWSDFGIGRQGNESLNGEITELIVHNVSLNDAERIITENYLSAKYGITLSANDLYDKDDAANGDYDYNMVGIGRIDASNFNTEAQGNGILRISNPSGLDDDEYFFFGHNNDVLGTFGNGDVPSGLQGRWFREWRVSEVNSSKSSVDIGSIDMDFDLTGMTYANVADIGLIVDTDNDGVFADETPIFGATDLGSNIIRFSGVTAIDNNMRFTLGTNNLSGSPLPIELMSFEAIGEDHQVNLFWSTSSETNTSHFRIEKSVDGDEWIKVEEVAAGGNSTSQIDYYTIDNEPYSGKSFYRLVQFDNNGDFKAYNPVPVYISNEEESGSMVLFPNPTSQDNINLSLRELSGKKVLVVLRDITGAEHFSKITIVTSANEIIAIDPSKKLAPGTYLITASSENLIYSEKLIIK